MSADNSPSFDSYIAHLSMRASRPRSQLSNI